MLMAVRAESPHFYNADLLIEMMPDLRERRSFALQQSKDESEIRKRYEISYETNQKYHNQISLTVPIYLDNKSHSKLMCEMLLK